MEQDHFPSRNLRLIVTTRVHSRTSSPTSPTIRTHSLSFTHFPIRLARKRIIKKNWATLRRKWCRVLKMSTASFIALAREPKRSEWRRAGRTIGPTWTGRISFSPSNCAIGDITDSRCRRVKFRQLAKKISRDCATFMNMCDLAAERVPYKDVARF